MTAPLDPDARRALTSLMAFWADAGVGVSFEDAPVDRMAEGRKRLQAPPRPVAPRGPAPPVQPAGLPGAAIDVSLAVAQAQAMAAAAGTLQALEAAIGDFEGCGLRYSGAARAVFSRGRPGAPVMIIGEGPGAEEDREGRPFVGRAGKLLDRMIAAAGLTDQVFITNTVFWRPPGNRTPTPQEQAVCAPFVERAIVLAKPQVLLLAGAASAKSMLKRNEGILSLRGRWSEWRGEHTDLVVPALPTLHPAFLLRQPQAKKKAWMDLLSLAQRLDRPGGSA
ncbi:MAG: uracil-DNA glycosylase [Caulobacterales bacterium 32-69-10]|nr:MAG: uracil-DNA glycosylase [Caulobacterales bacterium 32-69-10]